MSCGSLFKDQMVPFSGFPSIWGLLGLEFQLVSFFMLKTHVPVDIMEELSPNMILVAKSKMMLILSLETLESRCKNRLRHQNHIWG
jgi:hypothetical protein